jgi:uncharacterized membrane protein YeaQ/YmgE (transglycosylase-associated protein family)
MPITIELVLEWLILSALAGGLAGLLATRKKEGFGRFQNLLIGLVGTAIGLGTIYLLKKVNILKADLIKGGVNIPWQDLIAACIGALLFLTVMHFLRKRKSKVKA